MHIHAWSLNCRYYLFNVLIKGNCLSKNHCHYYLYIDIEKAFDKILQEGIEWPFCQQKVAVHFVYLFIVMCCEIITTMKNSVCLSWVFDVNDFAHQGSSLILLLFIVMMEEVTQAIVFVSQW